MRMGLYGKTDRWWEQLLTGANPVLPFRQFRHIFGLLPTNPRYKFCHAPFEGSGSAIMRLIGKRRSRLSPQLCMQCESFARNIPGGAEIELTMLFADVRGSTALAEKMSPYEFSQLINHLFVSATEILVKTHGWVDRLVGDQVIGLFVPGFAGPQHASLGIRAALDLLFAMGHAQPDGPQVPVGVGVNTDVAFVGAVGTAEGATDITVLGDAANTTARLSSMAKTGEILVSEAAVHAAAIPTHDREKRKLALKGKREPIIAYVLTVEDQSLIEALPERSG